MSNNPAINNEMYEKYSGTSENSMTLSGTINKCLILLSIAIIGALGACSQIFAGYMDKVKIILIASVILSIVFACTTVFFKQHSKYLAPLFAFFEGATLGICSFVIEKSCPGIAIQAFNLTFLVLFVMLALYKAKIIQATEKFKAVMSVGLISIFVFYLVTGIATWIFHANIPILYNSSIIGIGLNLVIAGFASLCFILDFDNIERGLKDSMPKYFEWYFSFSLMVSIVWLYVELLKLLARLRNR